MEIKLKSGRKLKVKNITLDNGSLELVTVDIT